MNKSMHAKLQAKWKFHMHAVYTCTQLVAKPAFQFSQGFKTTFVINMSDGLKAMVILEVKVNYVGNLEQNTFFSNSLLQNVFNRFQVAPPIKFY